MPLTRPKDTVSEAQLADSMDQEVQPLTKSRMMPTPLPKDVVTESQLAASLDQLRKELRTELDDKIARLLANVSEKLATIEKTPTFEDTSTFQAGSFQKEGSEGKLAILREFASDATSGPCVLNTEPKLEEKKKSSLEKGSIYGNCSGVDATVCQERVKALLAGTWIYAGNQQYDLIDLSNQFVFRQHTPAGVVTGILSPQGESKYFQGILTKSDKPWGDIRVCLDNGKAISNFRQIGHFAWQEDIVAVRAQAVPPELTEKFVAAPRVAEHSGSTSSAVTPMMQKNARTARQIDVEHLVIKDAHLSTLAPTVWETAIFIGLPQLGFTGSFMLSVALIINIFIQISFTLIIGSTFPSKPLDLMALDTWRHTVGHDFNEVDAYGFSLVSRVCDEHPTLSVALQQSETFTDAGAYTSRHDGPTLCIISISIWFLVMMKEVERTVKITKETWFVPTSKRTRVSLSDDKRWNLDSLHRGRKVFMGLVCILRLSVAIMLFWRGNIFLVFTISITELVLNAAGLAFIFEVDELLCEIFAPKVAKVMLDRLDIHVHADPDQKKNYTFIVEHQHMIFGMFRLFCFFAFTTTNYLAIVHPNVSHLREAIDILCGGKLNFAVGRNKDLGMAYFVQTRSSLVEKQDNPEWEAVESLIVSRRAKAITVLPDVASMATMLTMTATQLADKYMHACEDVSPGNLTVDLQSYWAQLVNILGLTETSTCEDIRSECDDPSLHLVRMLCPATCRCYFSKPFSAVSKGCPYLKCQGNKATAGYYDTSMNCTDDELFSLVTNPNWRSYWLSWTEFQKEKSWSDVNLEDSRHVFDLAMTAGCPVIARYNLWSEVCAGNLEFNSVGTFCPESCRCASTDLWG